MKNVKRKETGFTLIEILITVAIVGIVAAIAIPSYVGSIRKSHRADAKNALTQLSQFMEKTYTLYGSYYQDNNGNVVGSANYPLPFTTSPAQGTTYYNLTLSGASTSTPTIYTLTATPVGGQANDSCGTLTLNNFGQKTPTTTGCW